MVREFSMIAKTFKGLEEVLAQELIALGANNVQIGRRAVSFTGDKAMLYRANFCLRTALRVISSILSLESPLSSAIFAASFSSEIRLGSTVLA